MSWYPRFRSGGFPLSSMRQTLQAKLSQRRSGLWKRIEILEQRLLLSTYFVNNVDDSGAGSLRQAIIDANLNAGSDSIVFLGASGTITLTSGPLQITDPVSILGPGATT